MKKEKLFKVYGSTATFWIAIVKARSREEAKKKAQEGDIEDYDEEPVPTEPAVGDIEEVRERRQQTLGEVKGGARNDESDK